MVCDGVEGGDLGDSGGLDGGHDATEHGRHECWCDGLRLSRGRRFGQR